MPVLEILTTFGARAPSFFIQLSPSKNCLCQITNSIYLNKCFKLADSSNALVPQSSTNSRNPHSISEQTRRSSQWRASIDIAHRARDISLQASRLALDKIDLRDHRNPNVKFLLRHRHPHNTAPLLHHHPSDRLHLRHNPQDARGFPRLYRSEINGVSRQARRKVHHQLLKDFLQWRSDQGEPKGSTLSIKQA